MVDVTREKGRLQVSVSDDGIGIAPETLRDLKSLGLVGMRERIFRVGGDFKIHSHPGSGTRIEIALGS
jgi:signal transduction histidine kinase